MKGREILSNTKGKKIIIFGFRLSVIGITSGVCFFLFIKSMYILKNINYFVRSGINVKYQCLRQIRELKFLPEICWYYENAVSETRETLSGESQRLRQLISVNFLDKLLQLESLEMPRAKATKKAAPRAVAAKQNGAVKSMDGNGTTEWSPTKIISEDELKNTTNLLVTAKVTKGRGKGKKVTEAAVVEVHSPREVAEAVVSGRGGRKKAIVATIENGDVAEPAAKVLMQIKMPAKAKGRGKKDASINEDEIAPTAAVETKRRGRERNTAAEDVSIKNAENQAVASEAVSSTASMKAAAKGRKRKDQPISGDVIESEKIVNEAEKEETAVPPKKRVSATTTTTTKTTSVKIKSEPLSTTQVDQQQKLHEPAAGTVLDVQITDSLSKSKRLPRTKSPTKPEKPKKGKAAAASRSKSTKHLQEVSEANNTEELSEEKAANTEEEISVAKSGRNVSPAKPAARGKKRALSTSKATTELSISHDLKTEKVDGVEGESSPKKKRGGKTAARVTKGAAKQLPPMADDEVSTETKGEKKPAASRSRKRPAAANAATANEEESVDGAKPSKSKKVANDTETNYNKADFELPATDSSHKDSQGVDTRYNLKISSWNVAGLRSWCKKDGLKFLEYEEPDIFCMQEIKCTTDQLPEEAARIPGYHPYWLCMPGGYAGVAIYSKIMPINVEYGLGNAEFDEVGRLITAEYEKFFLVCVYVPNSGRKLVNLEARMRWEKLFQAFVKRLDARKPVVMCGDMNVSHNAIDLANPKTNTRNAGFTQEERDKMTELLALGYVDTFRHLYPTRTGAYTFWTYMGNARARNVGWRLDYFLVSQRLTKRVVESCIRAQCKGSDHCPITLFLKL